MNESINYKELYTEIITRQVVILGSRLAITKAKSISSLVVSESGQVIDYQGDPQKILNDLISVYVSIFGTIVLESIKPIVENFSENNNITIKI